MNSFEKDSYCFGLTEIYIKTESQEDESESTVVESSFYAMRPSYDGQVETSEPIVKLECENSKNESTETPLDSSRKIKVKKYIPNNLDVNEPKIKTEPTEGADNIFSCKHFLDTEENPDFYGSSSINQVAYEEIKEHLSSESEHETQFEMVKIKEEKHVIINEEKPKSPENQRNKNLEGNESISTPRKHVCSICNKIFRWKNALEGHFRTHAGVKPFSCTICQKTFTFKNNLNKHMLLHNAEKPYACDGCNYLFRSKFELNKHKVVHNDTKPFTCCECNKSFRRNHDLTQHNRIHIGLKPFACEYCNKLFTQKSHLITHRRVHTGERPFSCDICQKSFTQSSDLNRHTKIHNKVKLVSAT